MSEIPKAYDPAKVEQKWYSFWLAKGYFTPKIDRSRQPFTLIMPPPNVTGELHVGHALTATLEDIMVRWHRMKGDATLWLPGADHAGIATQVVVEQRLAREGKTRQEIGRERFEEKVWEWVKKCHQTIVSQHQRLGASCDWSRERFTLDDGPSRAVRTAFVRLYEKGLIYRGERIINWCPRCQTALSDLEVQHKEVQGNLYYIRYRLAEGDGFVTVATTRPETYLGDTAVAVNPDDKRFKHLLGKKVILPVLGRVIPIVADSAVDSSFGAGALKITPAHDPVDFEVAQRHNLPFVSIFNADATINENGGPYRGLDRFEAREKVLADLKKTGLLEKIEPYVHSVGHCDRCQTMIEPIVSLQWFVKTAPLAKPAIEAVTNGRIVIVPEHFVKTYLNWMENIRDWCISRQLWWGHRIPVWYCQQCGAATAAIDTPAACPECASTNLIQDPDVLDTWFSSALWPHSTLGWPEATEDLKYFYPTNVMETGYDILFFWVARMIMMGIEDTGEIPFRTVYLHGLVRDEKGDKMSKLRGNVMSPTDLIESHGADALRFALITGNTPGNDLNFGVQKLDAARNFANKIWNASRFILRSLPDNAGPRFGKVDYDPHLPLEDRWIISRLNQVMLNVDRLMDQFQFGEAAWAIHEFFWGEFCDWYIELSKIRLQVGAEPSPLPVLLHVLDASLRLLHPFMPFLTEEVWQQLQLYLLKKGESIVIASFPVGNAGLIDTEAERDMEAVIEIIRSIRNARADYKVTPGRWIEARVYADGLLPAVKGESRAVEVLARVRPLTVYKRHERPEKEKALVMVLKEAEVVLPWAGMIDIEAEKKRLQAEMDVSRKETARLEGQLVDAAFLSKAPPVIVDKERNKLQSLRDKLARLTRELSQFD